METNIWSQIDEIGLPTLICRTGIQKRIEMSRCDDSFL